MKPVLLTTTWLFMYLYLSLNACKTLGALAVEKEEPLALQGLYCLPELVPEKGALPGGYSERESGSGFACISSGLEEGQGGQGCGRYSEYGSSGSTAKKSSWPGGSGEGEEERMAALPGAAPLGKRGRRWLGVAVVCPWPPWGVEASPEEEAAVGLPEEVLLGWDFRVCGMRVSIWFVEF